MGQDEKPESWWTLILELGISFLMAILVISIGILHIIFFPIVIGQMIHYYREAQWDKAVYDDYKRAVASLAARLKVENTLEAVAIQYDRIVADQEMFMIWDFLCWKAGHVNRQLAFMSFPWYVGVPARALYHNITSEINHIQIDPQKNTMRR